MEATTYIRCEKPQPTAKLRPDFNNDGPTCAPCVIDVCEEHLWHFGPDPDCLALLRKTELEVN